MRMLYIIYSIIVTTVVTGINLPGTGGGTTLRSWGTGSYSSGSSYSGGSFHK